jgi:CubicO group peptidase (beta-lactamase class C family)
MDMHQLRTIDRFLECEYIDSGRFPGLSLSVMHRGRLVHRFVTGMADIENARPMQADTIVRIYSMTKPITSVVLMMLVEQGVLQIDDPVERFIPEWRDLSVYVGGSLEQGFTTRRPDRPMLIIDLLRHTAGLTYGFQAQTPVDAAYRTLKIGDVPGPRPLDEIAALLVEVPLEFSPGDAWLYSIATDIVGLVIERATGHGLATLCAQWVFEPLGMADTGFQVGAQARDRLASCYARTDARPLVLVDPADNSMFLQPPVFVSGGGGLVSTADDFLKFAEALRTGRPRLVGRKTRDLMTANHLPGGAELHAIGRGMSAEASYDGLGFGLGFATTLDAHRTGIAGSNGDYFWGGAASTFFLIDPAEELSVVFLTQLLPSSAYPVRRQLRSMLYAALD